MFTRVGALIGKVSDIKSYRIVAVALSVSLFGGIEFAVHEVLAALELPMLTDAIIDASLVGCSFGFAVWLLLVGNCDRRARVRQDLERIAELNHEIRNALQVIAHSHYNEHSEHRDMVMDSVTRIDSVLNRAFPVVGGSGTAI